MIDKCVTERERTINGGRCGRPGASRESQHDGRQEGGGGTEGRVTPWAIALIRINSQVLLLTLAKDERKA